MAIFNSYGYVSLPEGTLGFTIRLPVLVRFLTVDFLMEKDHLNHPKYAISHLIMLYYGW